MPTIPVDIVNRALDECGLDEIGDMEDGSDAARAAERIYWPTLRQLLSAAHWNFARKQQPLNLLADLSGVSSPFTDVPNPWGYMYEWPPTCVHARWVPQSYPQVDSSGVPIFSVSSTGGQITSTGRPTPFIVASADRANDIASNWYDVEGHDPEQTKVILTNQSSALLVFTGLMQYPDAWDGLFEQAMVSGLAARLAMPLIKDKREARVIRSDNIQIARQALDAARVRDGDEGWTVMNHIPDWIRVRDSSAIWYDGPGMLYYGWTSVPWLEGAGGVF
jgi:hypothetical protein